MVIKKVIDLESSIFCSYLHAVRVVHLIIQLHHGLVLSDHARSGGLPSAGHDDGRSWVPLDGPLPSLGACVSPVVI